MKPSRGSEQGSEQGVDTIAAVASAAGGGVGIVRMSGPEAVAIARRHFRGLPRRVEARRLYHGWWRDAAGRALDEGLLVVMPGPRSFTGEDVVELHVHGGALNLRQCLAVCLEAGARLAEAGEFTRRAFLNGRIDLTRAEAIADMVTAQTERALRLAREHLRGALYEAAMGARERLLGLRARLEVNIDFVEEDVPLMDPAGLAAEARALGAELAGLAGTWRRGHLLRDGARVVLLGAPNAGKSSLFNALCGADRAIVTALPGTTRDTLEEAVDVLGVPVVVVDTAGVREALDVVEAAGVERTHRQAAQAELVLVVLDGSGEGDAAAEAEGLRAGLPADVPTVLVTTKADLPGARTAPGGVRVSAVSGEGLEALREAMVRALGGAAAGGGGLTIARERHRVALTTAAEALARAAEGLVQGLPPELVAVDVQEATDALAELVGLTTIEDVLDRLFAAFCIGK